MFDIKGMDSVEIKLTSRTVSNALQI